jgi:dynein heavy chain
MSCKGVTQFAEGNMEFSTLDQFERDYFLFTQLMKLRIFKSFRLWKALKASGGGGGRRREEGEGG